METDKKVTEESEQEDDQVSGQQIHSLGKQMTDHVDNISSLEPLHSECSRQAEVTDFEVHLQQSGILKHSDSRTVSYSVENVKHESDDKLGVRQNSAVEERDNQAPTLQIHSLEKQMTDHVDNACSLVTLHSECSQQVEVTDFEVHLQQSGIFNFSDSSTVSYPVDNVKHESDDKLGVRQNSAVEEGVLSQMCSPEENSITFDPESTSFSKLKVFRNICGTFRFERKNANFNSLLTEKSNSFEYESSGISTENKNLFEEIIDSSGDNNTIGRCKSKELKPNVKQFNISDTIKKQTKKKHKDIHTIKKQTEKKHKDILRKLVPDTEKVQEQKMKRRRDSHSNRFQNSIKSTENVQVQKIKKDRDSHSNLLLKAKENSGYAQVQKIKGERNSHLNILQHDSSEIVQEQTFKGARDSLLNMFKKKRTSSGNVQESEMKGDRDSLSNMFKKKRTRSGNVQESEMKGDRDSLSNMFKKKRTSSGNVHESEMKGDRDSLSNMFKKERTSSGNVQEPEMKGDRDSLSNMFEQARKSSENDHKQKTSSKKVQEQKMKGDRDSYLDIFQKHRTSSKNVPKQKIKGDTDSYSSMFKKARTGSKNDQVQKIKGNRDSHSNTFQKERTASENVQEQNMKGDRDPHSNMFKKARINSENVEEQKMKGDRDSHSNMFKKARTNSENIQEQKIKGDRDSHLNMFKKARTNSENVQEQKMEGDRYSHSKMLKKARASSESVRDQKVKRDRDSHSKNLKKTRKVAENSCRFKKMKGGKDLYLNMFRNDITGTKNVGEQKTQNRLDQSSYQRSEKQKTDSFSQYLRSLDDRRLSTCSRPTYSNSSAYMQYYKSEIDNNKSMNLKKKREKGKKIGLMNTHGVNVKRYTLKSNSQQRVKKCRYNKSEEQRYADKVKDRERKKTARGKWTEERKIAKNEMDAERKKFYRLNRTQEQIEIDSDINAERMQILRHNRTPEEIKIDHVIDAQRKESDRLNRTQEEIKIDSAINAERMQILRHNRTQEEIEIDRVIDAQRKESDRLNRTQEQIEIDHVIDAQRKESDRLNRTQEQIEMDHVSDAQRKESDRLNRTQEEIEIYHVIDAQRKQSDRLNRTQEEIEIDHVIDAQRKQSDRLNRTQEEIEIDHVIDAQRKQSDRLNRTQEEIEIDRSEDRKRKRQERQLQVTIDCAINRFKQVIREGPSYICSSCNRLLFRRCVYRYSLEDFQIEYQPLAEKCRTNKLSSDSNEYICTNCRNSLKKGQLPAMSVANGLQLDDIPQQLHELTSLEVIFIARRIPFMKLLGLPRGKQKAIHGCVVNVPVEPEQAVAVLPRVPSPDTVIPVRLNRKIQYRGHVLMQNIRPQKIRDALSLLKYGLSNPLYDDVVVNEDWESSSRAADSNLWDALTREPNNIETEDIEGNDEGSDEDEENKEDAIPYEDENSKLRGLPFDSCLQPKAVTADTNLMLNVAPGEGKKPEPFEKDQNSEELSFPHLFPTGKFGYSMQRQSKISMKKYFQTRILNSDGRFSKSIEYIFYAQYRTEAKEIADSLSIALRKGKQTDVTAGDLKNRVESLIRNDLGIHFLQNIRGSPAFFNKLLYDLLGMIRQLGPCTWFVTLSAADLKWKDTIRIIAAQQGQTLTDQEIDDLTWEQKCTWLRSNPVTAARHFDHRIDLFMKHILLNKNINPLGEITDFKYRIEFQQRGSPHVHMLLWVTDAPDIESSLEEDVQKFVDKHVSCALPVDNEDLTELLLLVQRHTHSLTCRKHGQACRFHFPRLPVRHTTAFKPVEEEITTASQETYKEILATVHEQLDKIDQDTQISLDSVLEKANVAEAQYMRALRWFKTKSGRPAIVLKREPCEIFINNYNKVIMMSWEANHDVQFVTSVLECVFYVASYMSKPEKTLGDLLKGVCKAGQHLGPKGSMKAVAKKFLTHWEVSAQEAVYRLLSLPLTKGSRQVIFIPTDLPENRTRLFKPMKLIETLEDDDLDVFQMSILDRYEARPVCLEELCLAEFVARYTYSAKPRQSANAEDVSESEDDIEEQKEELPKLIQLLKDRGYMSLRRKHAVVRSHQFSQVKEPEKYYHAQLLLYCPWREEVPDLLDDTYQNSYTEKEQIITPNRERFEHHVEEVNNAIDNLAENGPPDEGWGNLAPQTEQLRDEERREGATPDEENVLQGFEVTDERHAARDLRLIPHEYDLQSENVSNQEWYNMVISLNENQFKVHDFITSWCTDMILTHRAERPQPFHIFLTGGAGVGKSHLVRTVVLTATNIFNRNNQTDHNHVLVCAPTGTAAYNIAGHTIHSAFLLPIIESKYDDYVPLSHEKLAGLKDAIGDIKILVLDEISMVGTDQLLSIHRRLCDIMGNEDPFGGVSVLAVGDLLQLPPVGKFPIFDLPTDETAALYGSLWQNHFQMIELTDIVRQKNDQNFASLLNRVRIGKQTLEDIEILKQREIKNSSPDYPKLAPHIFALNADKDKHNKEILHTLTCPIYTFKAMDSKRDSQTGRVNVTSFPKDAGGLSPEVTVGVGARVTQTQNIDVSDGLVNSATGYVTGFIPPPPAQDTENWVPKYILIKFDDDRVGKKCRALNKGLLNGSLSTPIPAVENQVRLGKYSKVTAKRKQFPLALAWGGTIHKEQGKTEDRVVLSCKGPFQPGQFYTGISRTKTLEGLFILDELNCKKITTSRKHMQEIARMKKDAAFSPPIPLIIRTDPELYLKVGFLNVNSLVAHSSSVKSDRTLLSCQVIALAETWLTPGHEHPDLVDFGCLRHDSIPQRTHRSGGLLMYIHHEFHVVKQILSRDVNIENLMVILSPRWNPDIRFCVIVMYKNPRMTARQFLPQMEKTLISAPVHSVPTVIMGDLNIDYLSKQNSSGDLENLMLFYGFSQHVKKPTHRRGGLLDHFYYNRKSSLIQVDTKAVYYSDHLQLCATIPYPSFHEN